MTKETLTHADNLDEVQEIALDLFEENRQYKSENKILQEQIKNLQDKLFGRKSEKAIRDDGQFSLFDIPEPEPSKEPEEITIIEHTRKKRGRKPLTADLPRIEVVHELDEEQRKCGCGHLKMHIGQEVSE